MRVLILSLFLSFSVCAQEQHYPQGYFRNPLSIPILLAGNFGECRPGHFHSGIDIKTEGKENQAVFAAADGYISRVKMEPGGFGHGIYITHPNGYTTLYAHLNDFFPELQKLVREKQYEKKSWELDLHFDADKFPVKKGQQIAWSGNTGGSSAPHLHFEIRDTKTEHPLNPMLFDLEIKDSIAPQPSELALYNASESLYEQDALRILLKKKGKIYTPQKDTLYSNSAEVYLGLAVNDFMDNSENTLSFFTAEWYAGEELQGKIALDDIGYDETRYLNACADYKTHKQADVWFNSLFVLPNNKLSRIYTGLKNSRGQLHLNENEYLPINIVLKDANGNESRVVFTLALKGVKTISSCTPIWQTGQKNELQNPGIKCSLGAAALYDNICFKTGNKSQAGSISQRWKLHEAYVPVHTYFDLSIKPDRAVPFSMSNKVALLYSDEKSISGKAATLTDGWHSASVRNFGEYWLVIDTTAPAIKAVAKSGLPLGKRKEIRFIVSDNYTSVKKFNGTLNGNWLCFEQHGNDWFYHIDEHCPKGKNILLLSATDENGNERKLQYSFTR